MGTEEKFRLVIPNISHKQAYEALMEQWEPLEPQMQPELLRRGNAAYEKWLSWCEDDRTTGSMLSTGCPATLYFLLSAENEIMGAIVRNHQATHMGHLHAGIAPWHRGQGFGSLMLHLALEICREQGMQTVEVVTCKGNSGAIGVLEKNGGTVMEEFTEGDMPRLRYRFVLLPEYF